MLIYYIIAIAITLAFVAAFVWFVEKGITIGEKQPERYRPFDEGQLRARSYAMQQAFIVSLIMFVLLYAQAQTSIPIMSFEYMLAVIIAMDVFFYICFKGKKAKRPEDHEIPGNALLNDNANRNIYYRYCILCMVFGFLMVICFLIKPSLKEDSLLVAVMGSAVFVTSIFMMIGQKMADKATFEDDVKVRAEDAQL